LQTNQEARANFGRLWWLYQDTNYAPALRILNEFIAPYVQKSLSEKVDEARNFAQTLAGFTDNPKVIRDNLVNILLAGRDTTAATLSFLFQELAHDPQVYARLREEVLQHVGAEGEPTYSDLKEMKYLQNCLNETLRLYPIVPVNGRMALVDTTLPLGGGPDGTDVPPFSVGANISRFSFPRVQSVFTLPSSCNDAKTSLVPPSTTLIPRDGILGPRLRGRIFPSTADRGFVWGKTLR
jgi:cytochrome P450